MIALKQHFGCAKNETVLRRPNIDGIVGCRCGRSRDIGHVNALTRKEYVAVITTIRKSVIRHAALGPDAYFNLVQNDVQASRRLHR
jgi:hypothetical protein